MDVSVITDEDIAIDITLPVEEVDGDNIQFNIISDPSNGNVTISGVGTVTGIAITSPGVGYTHTNVPSVLISPPVYDFAEEENTVGTYEGDSGIIVGFGTTTVGVSTGYQLIFDFFLDAQKDPYFEKQEPVYFLETDQYYPALKVQLVWQYPPLIHRPIFY